MHKPFRNRFVVPSLMAAFALVAASFPSLSPSSSSKEETEGDNDDGFAPHWFDYYPASPRIVAKGGSGRTRYLGGLNTEREQARRVRQMRRDAANQAMRKLRQASQGA